MTESQKKITNKGPFDETIEYVIYDVGGPSNGGDKKEDCDTATTICIKGPTWGVNAKDITITSLSVTYKGGNPAPTESGVLDLSKASGNAAGSIQFNDDGSVTKNDKSEYILIPLGAEYKKGDVLKVTVWGSSDQPVRLWISSGPWDRMSEIKNPMKFGETYTLTLTENHNPPYSVQIKKQNANPENLTITKVKVEKVVSDEPTPAPTATPAPRPAAESFDVPLSKDTVKKADYYYIAEADNIFNEDGSVQFVLPSDGGLNAANAFYFKEDKTNVWLSDYAKLVVTLSSDQADTGYRIGIAPDNSLKWDDTILVSKGGKIGTTEETIELDLSKVAADTVGYGFVIQHTGWASSAKSPKITIKSIKAIAKSDSNL